VEIPDNCHAPFHESALRSHLLAGCEPTAIFVVFVVCVILGFSVPTIWGIFGDVLLFVFCRQVLVEMAKQDPKLITVHHEKQRYNQGVWTAKPQVAVRWRSR